MKVVIPVDEKRLAANVCVSFGRSPYFLIYDVETKTSAFVENPGAVSTGGAGIKAAQTVVDQDADVLLTPRLGENGAELLQAAEVKIYRTMYESAEENITAWMAGELPVLAKFHAGFHGHAGQ